MTTFSEGTDVRSDDALEELLKKASPRPVPSQQDEAAVRSAVKAEWRSVTGKRRVRRNVFQYALAATVLLGVFALFSMFRVPDIEAVEVASIEKSFGAIYMLGEEAELRETGELSSVLSGQTIVTGDDAGLALAWGKGGSLRVDENSRVAFTGDSGIFLGSGRVYFDSQPSSMVAGITSGGSPEFTVVTEHGAVMHTGTQFMTRAGSEELVVSVREGQVAIDGLYYEHAAASGEQVTFSGRQRPTVLSIGRSGQNWDWVARTSPPVDMDGKTIRVFLDWACRELGLELKFEGGAEPVADRESLKGTVDIEPADALRIRLASAALDYRIEEGVLYVSD